MPTYEELGRMSQSEWDLYKKQFQLQHKSLSPEDRRSVLLRSQTGQEETRLAPSQGDGSFWQQVLKPLQWAHEEVVLPIASTLTAPFSPSVPGTEGLPWRERQLREYEQWDAPWGAKGAVETLPWLAIPTAGGIAGKLATTAARGGRLARPAALAGKAILPAVKAEALVGKAVTTVLKPVTAPLQALGAKVIAAKWFQAPSNEIIERQITNMDWQRKVAQYFGRKPVLGKITEAIGGKAATVGGTKAVEEVTLRGVLIGKRVQETLLNHRAVVKARLASLHPDSIHLFGIDEATGIAARVKAKPGFKGASRHINDIAEHPNKYIFDDPIAEQYIKEIHNIEDVVLQRMREEGIDVKLLKFDEFSHWVHRVVTGKKIDGKLVELTKGFGRIGSKQSFEKTRFYETAAEGMEQGLVYSPNLEQALDLYIQGAAKKIGDKRLYDMTASFGKTALERAYGIAPEVMAEATTRAAVLGAAKSLIKVANRALRGEKLPEATLKSIERNIPELGARLRVAGTDKAKLRTLIREAKKFEQLAKEPYWKAKAARARTMEIARTPSYGTEATIAHPAFQGKIYPKEVADAITEYWADKGFKELTQLATLSSGMRTLVAAADFSAMFIQGLPMTFRWPTQWGKAAGMSFKSFKDPQVYQDYITKNAESLSERVFYGGAPGGFEWFEAMPQLQKIAGAIAGKTGKKAIQQTYGRFEAGFAAFGDVARNEMWLALKGSAKSPDELMQVARHLDRMTGVMSMKGLGIGKTQRDFETAFVWFAPRYTRAGFALVGDMFKGGFTGAESRKALGSMMAGGAAFYAGTAKALGQEPNFDPTSARFMTIEIEDPVTGSKRHFGLGGIMTSMIRFGADLVATTMDNPQDLVQPLKDGNLNRLDNPFIKFMFSKSAPLTGFLTGMIEGKNYFGEPFENPGDYAKFMAEQVMPIAVQQTVMEEGGLSPTGIMAEMAGMRTFPQSDWEKRNEIRDRLSQEKYGMPWNDLASPRGPGVLAQRELERDSSELQEATDKASETSSKLARGEGKIWDAWRKDGDSIEEMYRQEVTLASREYESIGNGRRFKDRVDTASAVRRGRHKAREQNIEYAEIYEYFADPLSAKQLARMNPNDVARKDYYNLMYSDDMFDEFGVYKFEEADRREKSFIQQYGQGALDYVEEFMGAKWDEPIALKVLRESRRVLEPYWEIENQVWARYPPELKKISEQIKILENTDPRQAKMLLMQNPGIMMARKLIAMQKKMLKMQNPDIQWALNTFYSR